MNATPGEFCTGAEGGSISLTTPDNDLATDANVSGRAFCNFSSVIQSIARMIVLEALLLIRFRIFLRWLFNVGLGVSIDAVDVAPSLYALIELWLMPNAFLISSAGVLSN